MCLNMGDTLTYPNKIAVFIWNMFEQLPISVIPSLDPTPKDASREVGDFGGGLDDGNVVGLCGPTGTTSKVGRQWSSYEVLWLFIFVHIFSTL